MCPSLWTPLNQILDPHKRLFREHRINQKLNLRFRNQTGFHQDMGVLAWAPVLIVASLVVSPAAAVQVDGSFSQCRDVDLRSAGFHLEHVNAPADSRCAIRYWQLHFTLVFFYLPSKKLGRPLFQKETVNTDKSVNAKTHKTTSKLNSSHHTSNER